MTCRYCGESYAANAGSDRCPKCGAPSGPGDATGQAARPPALVTAQDLRNLGLQPQWNQPQVKDGDGSLWISYTSKSGADGGIEIGIRDAGPDAEDTIIMDRLELGTNTQVSLSGADEAWVDVKGKGPAAALIFRRGPSVVVIRVPRGATAPQQLTALAALLIQRVPGTAEA